MAEKKWTQKDLAEASGLSQPSISRYLKAATEPKISDLVALANAFGVSLDKLSGLPAKEPEQINNDWRDRAIAAEAKVQMLKSGLSGLLKKIWF